MKDKEMQLQINENKEMIKKNTIWRKAQGKAHVQRHHQETAFTAVDKFPKAIPDLCYDDSKGFPAWAQRLFLGNGWALV